MPSFFGYFLNGPYPFSYHYSSSSVFYFSNPLRISKVTTKTGDKGKTELGDGKRVLKDHPVMVFIGEIDELNSHLGLAITASHDDLAGELRGIQQDLFNIGGEASMPGSDMELLPQDRVTF